MADKKPGPVQRAEMVLGEANVVRLRQEGAILVDEKALFRFLDACGDLSKCAGCGADIYWFRSRFNKNWPVTKTGANHFTDCPKADLFKRDRP